MLFLWTRCNSDVIYFSTSHLFCGTAKGALLYHYIGEVLRRKFAASVCASAFLQLLSNYVLPVWCKSLLLYGLLPFISTIWLGISTYMFYYHVGGAFQVLLTHSGKLSFQRVERVCFPMYLHREDPKWQQWSIMDYLWTIHRCNRILQIRE